MNIQNCPTSNVLGPCIAQGHCAGVARAPWFAHYMTSNKLMLPEDLAREAVKADVPIKEVAKWMGVETVGQAKKIIMEVAETSCDHMPLGHKPEPSRERYSELITGPNDAWQQLRLFAGSQDTVHGMTSDFMGKRHAAYYLEQLEYRNLNITWQAKRYSCHGCVRCMTLHYFTDVAPLRSI